MNTTVTSPLLPLTDTSVACETPAQAARQLETFADQYQALTPEAANAPRTASPHAPTTRERRIARLA